MADGEDEVTLKLMSILASAIFLADLLTPQDHVLHVVKG